MPLAPLLLAAAFAAGHDVAGRWTNPDGSVTVRVAPCGASLCGTVDEASAQAQADVARSGRGPLIGTVLLDRFGKSAPGRWRGTLFIPDQNKRVKAELRLVGDGRLRISGCLVGRMICRSQYWTRAGD